MTKIRTINVKKILDSKVEIGRDGFVWEFLSEKKVRYRLHFENWWIPFLAGELWKVVKTVRRRLQHQVSEMDQAMKIEPKD